jgi:hypothetical protein
VKMKIVRAFAFDWGAVVAGVFACWAWSFEWLNADYALRVRDVPFPMCDGVPAIDLNFHFINLEVKIPSVQGLADRVQTAS